MKTIIALNILLWSVLFAGPTYAQARCALSLILAIDVSSSVDPDEYALQMKGIANALRDNEVIESIRLSGGIQLFAFEWSGRSQQVDILPWTYVNERTGIMAAADLIEQHQRGYSDLPTALGFALGYSAIQLQKAPLACTRQAVDVSGDGVNNDGYEPRLAYKNFVFDGVPVNRLVIAGAQPEPVPYFKQEVIFGPGAFVEVAADFTDYERAMKRKLLREINGSALSLLNRN